MKFLSLEEQLFLDDLFTYKTVTKWKRGDDSTIKQGSKKSVIPIDIHSLRIKTIEWTKTKKTGEKILHIQIWKAPINDIEIKSKKYERRIYKTVSFDLIHCYHLISEIKQYKLNERWFCPVGRFYTEEQLNSLFKMKGIEFKALVKHVEHEFKEFKFIKAEIVKVYSRDENIDLDSIDYIKLYERLKQ